MDEESIMDFNIRIIEEMERNGFAPGFMAGTALMLARQGDFVAAAYGYRYLMRDNSQAGNQMFERLKRMFNEEDTQKIMEGVALLDSHAVVNVEDKIV